MSNPVSDKNGTQTFAIDLTVFDLLVLEEVHEFDP